MISEWSIFARVSSSFAALVINDPLYDIRKYKDSRKQLRQKLTRLLTPFFVLESKFENTGCYRPMQRHFLKAADDRGATFVTIRRFNCRHKLTSVNDTARDSYIMKVAKRRDKKTGALDEMQLRKCNNTSRSAYKSTQRIIGCSMLTGDR